MGCDGGRLPRAVRGEAGGARARRAAARRRPLPEVALLLARPYGEADLAAPLVRPRRQHRGAAPLPPRRRQRQPQPREVGGDQPVQGRRHRPRLQPRAASRHEPAEAQAPLRGRRRSVDPRVVRLPRLQDRRVPQAPRADRRRPQRRRRRPRRRARAVVARARRWRGAEAALGVGAAVEGADPPHHHGRRQPEGESRRPPAHRPSPTASHRFPAPRSPNYSGPTTTCSRCCSRRSGSRRART